MQNDRKQISGNVAIFSKSKVASLPKILIKDDAFLIKEVIKLNATLNDFDAGDRGLNNVLDEVSSILSELPEGEVLLSIYLVFDRKMDLKKISIFKKCLRRNRKDQISTSKFFE